MEIKDLFFKETIVRDEKGHLRKGVFLAESFLENFILNVLRILQPDKSYLYEIITLSRLTEEPIQNEKLYTKDFINSLDIKYKDSDCVMGVFEDDANRILKTLKELDLNISNYAEAYYKYSDRIYIKSNTLM